MSRGEGDIADSIVSSDGGSYSHAALWSGEGVVEARLDGVHERAVGFRRDVYRYMRDGVPLDPAVATHIVEIARSKIGGSYAKNELYLLGMLFAVGLPPRRSLLRAALDALGGDHAERLEELLTDNAFEDMPVICTEFVAAAFYEVSEDRSHALRILPREARPLRPGESAVRVRGLAGSQGPGFATGQPDPLNAIERCRSLVKTHLRASGAQQDATTAPARLVQSRKVLWGSVAVDALSDLKLGVVTPADLQFSPSLRFVGYIPGDAGS
jgi:hypothetical protein